METAYGLKEKILMASLIRDMGKAIENKKTDAVSEKRKIVLGKGLPPSTLANQRVPQYVRLLTSQVL
jgi:hypothetical protein